MIDWRTTFHDLIPDRVLVWHRAGLLRRQDAEALEDHLALCPICQLQFSELSSPEGTLQ
jgi:hypothetical protein